MSQEKTLGGERLGSGKKEKVYLKGYERSNHDLGYKWRSSMAPGTLVPFMSQVALNGDSFTINLNADALTHPTVGPLFGSYKLQLDVFQVPIRLYQAQLHNNKLGIGLKMNTIKLPTIGVPTITSGNATAPTPTQTVNPSCLLNYLGIAGTEKYDTQNSLNITKFNAIPYIGYYDIYKNYYANKQEENGYIIHSEPNISFLTLPIAASNNNGQSWSAYMNDTTDTTQECAANVPWFADTWLSILVDFTNGATLEDIQVQVANIGTTTYPTTQYQWRKISDIATEIKRTKIETSPGVYAWQIIVQSNGIFSPTYLGLWYYNSVDTDFKDREPKLLQVPLSDMDNLREDILSKIKDTTAYEIDGGSGQGLMITSALEYSLGSGISSCQFPMEGLAIKTYQSDLFNNWISTDWIDGENGISTITAISTAGDLFTIDTLNLSMKVYYMLNRIALSGGSYDDWQETVYDHEIYKRCETPIYLGGLSKEIVFQEVISNSASQSNQTPQPLGTLAGRGIIHPHKHKGGHIEVKIDEPSYLIGIISITPRICYSQGNTWDTLLDNMDDLHKPQLDEIGFQDLITSQMAWYGTKKTIEGQYIQYSAGKQPAWINYMTNVDVAKGNFASGMDENFMVLDRNYSRDDTATGNSIQDVTTYVDPAKYNQVFAYTRRDAQNFWVEVDLDIMARRKMSAKVMPNL